MFTKCDIYNKSQDWHNHTRKNLATDCWPLTGGKSFLLQDLDWSCFFFFAGWLVTDSSANGRFLDWFSAFFFVTSLLFSAFLVPCFSETVLLLVLNKTGTQSSSFRFSLSNIVSSNLAACPLLTFDPPWTMVLLKYTSTQKNI